MMIELRAGLVGFLFIASSAFAQSPASTPQPPVFGAETTLIHVDAVVTDKQGRQITDLKPDDFEIDSKGKKVTPAVATYVSLVDDEPPSMGRSSRNGAKLRAQDVRRVITFIVARPVIEMMGSSNIEGNMLITRRVDWMLNRFLDSEVKPHDLVAIVNADTRKPLLSQFTASPEAHRMAVDLLRKEWHNPDVPPVMLMPGHSEPLVRYCLDVVAIAQEVVKRQKDIPGRKLLFVVSGVLRSSDPPGAGIPAGFSDVGREMSKLVEQANRAGVTIYGIGPGGLGSGFSEALGLLADGTGGINIGNTDLLADNLGKVMELNRGYYLLGYDPGEAPKELPRSVKVHVRREGAKVAARPQVYQNSSLSADANSPGRERTLESLLNSPIAASGIDVRITPYLRWTGSRTGDFQAVVDIDPASVDLGSEPDTAPSVDLDILTRIVDQRGVVLKAERVALKSKLKDGGRRGIRFMVRAPLAAPGFYQADVSVQDKRSEKFGNATALAPLSDLADKKQTLALSSLELRPDGQPDAIPMDRFSSRSPVLVSCRVAHAQRVRNSREASLQIQLRIKKDGESVIELEPRALSRALPDLIDINGQIDLSELEPGDYVAEVEISDLLGERGRNKATATARFSVIDL